MQQRLLTAIRMVAISLCVLAAGTAPAQAQYDDRYDDRYEDDYRYEGDYDDPPERVARISFAQGDVSFSPAGEGEWYRALINRPLVRGDHLYTGNGGLAEFQFGDAAVRIDEYTAVQILSLDDGYAQVELAEGTLNLFVRRLYRDQVVEIATPTLALVVSEPGSYRIDVDPQNGQTDVLVWDGAAEAYGTRASFPLRDGDAVRFYDADLRDYEIYRLPRPDRFDRFAFERDERMRSSQSLAYLPEGVIGYEDLDRYGRWDNVREHGRVWYPRDVARDWAPYRNGHWIWQEPWGWTWVDAAPWGFAPFHYGRWAHINDRWGWIPGPRQVRAVYAPALVAFIGGRNFSVGISLGSSSPVGWFPLGPREVYVPPYYASRDYFRRVNVSNTVINNTTITNVYNTYYVQDGRQRQSGLSQLDYRYRARADAMTVVSSDAFVRGRSVREARIAVDQRATAQTEVRRFAAVAPQQTSLVGGMTRTSNVRPAREVLQRQVIARRAPEPDVVPFAARVEQLQRNQGRPLARQQVERIRSQRGTPQAQAQAQPEVRVVGKPAQRIERTRAAAAATDRELPRGQVTRGSRPPAVQRGIEQRRAREAAEAQEREAGPATQRQPLAAPTGGRDDDARGRAARAEDAQERERAGRAPPQRGQADRGQDAREQAERDRVRGAAQEREDRDRAAQERTRSDSERSERERVERGRVESERAAAERATQARGRQQREQAEERARDERAAEQARGAEQAAARARQATQEREQRDRAAAAERQAEQAREAQAARQAEQAREQRARQAEQAREAQAARQAEQAREQQRARQAEQAREAQAARQAEQAREQQRARQADAAQQAERGRAEQQAREAAAARARGQQRAEPAPPVQRDDARPQRGRGRGRSAEEDDEEEDEKEKERGRR